MCARRERERERLLTRPSGWRTIAGAYRRLRIYGSAPQLSSPFLHTGCPASSGKTSQCRHRRRGRAVARGWTCIAGDLLWCTIHRARSHYIPSLSPSFFLSISLFFSLFLPARCTILPQGDDYRYYLSDTPRTACRSTHLLMLGRMLGYTEFRKPSDLR